MLSIFPRHPFRLPVSLSLRQCEKHKVQGETSAKTEVLEVIP